LVVGRIEPREADVVAILDMSLSMTGDKLALTALAVAILRIKLERLAVVSFDSTAHILVHLDEDVPVREVVRRVLRVPAQGFTNIDAGLRFGLAALRRGRHRERVGIVMTDGVANMGANPTAAAARMPRLHVVQVGPEEPQGARACRAMATAGRGRRYRAVLYSQLPGVVRRLVRECFGA
ncbi:MAG: vWA domain-containing protein, partial [Myxococcota bacterium]|nr:vWA domain-containing protein [Myxococcota bacterium]